MALSMLVCHQSEPCCQPMVCNLVDYKSVPPLYVPPVPDNTMNIKLIVLFPLLSFLPSLLQGCSGSSLEKIRTLFAVGELSCKELLNYGSAAIKVFLKDVDVNNFWLSLD